MPANYREICVANWSECLEEIAEIKVKCGKSLTGIWFRGHSSSKWSLSTTLERATSEFSEVSEYFRLVTRIKPQIETFTEGAWELPSFEQVIQQCETFDNFRGLLISAYSYLAHLRHHGFPSPFLDWTGSPHIAAYFALRHAKPDEEIAIYAFCEQPENMKGTSSAWPMIIALGPVVKTHVRHFRQQSRYSMACSFADHRWKFVPHEKAFGAALPNQDMLWKIILPARERVALLQELDQYNLNEYTLFGSEEALMTTLAIREIDFT